MRYYLVIAVSMLILSCAQIQSPTGGPEDLDAPVLITEASTPNGQVNFRPDRLEFTFDEWSKLSSRGRNILISPTPERSPKYYFKRKTLIVEFDEEDTLQENTTYLIQFGNEVVDLTEGNPWQDFTYVFSTGGYLDSLTLSGVVQTENEKTELHQGFVLMFDTLIDTPFQHQVPYYRGRVDSSGHFMMHYLKAGDYFMASYVDENENNRYDVFEEEIGFLDFRINPDMVDELPPIQLFVEEEPAYLEDVDSLFASDLLITFVNEPYRLDITSDQLFSRENEDKKAKLFFLDTVFPKTFYLSDTLNAMYDTITIAAKGDKLVPIPSVNPALTQASIDVEQDARSFQIVFDLPVRLMDSSLVTLSSDDSTSLLINSIHSRAARYDKKWTVRTAQPLMADSLYGLQILPGAFTGIWEEAIDTQYVALNPRVKESGGTLNVTAINLDSSTTYLLEIIPEKPGSRSIKAMRPTIIDSTAEYSMSFLDLEPGQYKIFITEDKNNDGFWTTGDMSKRRPPEPRYTFYPDEVRQNWESDFSIDMR